MAVIPLQGLQSNERFSTRARKRITAFSKGLSEVLAGIAEPGMRYATIYMALATGIPAINYGPLFSFCEGIVIALPEFVLIGAFGIAENAYREGKKVWAIALFIVCFLLAGIVLLTFIDIFIVQFPEFYLKLLNFGRCIIAVSFSIILGKLEDEGPVQNAASLHVQPIQPPIQPVHIEEIGKLTEEVNRLSALMLQMSQTVNVYINSGQMDRAVQTHIQPVQEPIQQIAEVAGSIHDDRHIAPPCSLETAPEAPAIVYPEVAGIDASVVKLVIDERLKGVAWSMVASNLGKNYSRIVKPIRDVYMATCIDIQDA